MGSGYEMVTSLGCHFGTEDRDFHYPTQENRELLISTYGFDNNTKFVMGEKGNEKTPRLYFDVEDSKVAIVYAYAAAQDKMAF